MRCVVCDGSDVGLSDYLFRNPHRHSFHLVGQDYYCNECYLSGEEVLDEWQDEENQREEEDGAFEYE